MWTLEKLPERQQMAPENQSSGCVSANWEKEAKQNLFHQCWENILAALLNDASSSDCQ